MNSGVCEQFPNTMEPTSLLTVVHGTVIESIPMDCDAHASPTGRPIPDPREHDTLISRVLVAERHSSLFESEVKRLELENKLLNEKLEDIGHWVHELESQKRQLYLDVMCLESKNEEWDYLQHH